MKFKVGDTASELVVVSKYPQKMGFKPWKIVAVGDRYYTLQRSSTIWDNKYFKKDYGFLRAKRHLYTDDEVAILSAGYIASGVMKANLEQCKDVKLAIMVLRQTRIHNVDVEYAMNRWEDGLRQ